MEVGKLPLIARRMMKSQEMSGSRAPGVSNYRLGRGGKKGWGQTSYSWVWEADQDGSARAREWEARQLGRLYHLPPQPCPSTLCSLPCVSFLICVFPHLRSLCPSSYTSTRWPVRIKIKALRASSCQTVFCFFIWVLWSVLRGRVCQEHSRNLLQRKDGRD